MKLLKYYLSNYWGLHAFSLALVIIIYIVGAQYEVGTNLWFWIIGVVNALCLIFGIISYKR